MVILFLFSVFSYTPIIDSMKSSRTLFDRTQHRIDSLKVNTYETIVAATMTGQIALIRCEGSEPKADLIKREKITNVIIYVNITSYF